MGAPVRGGEIGANQGYQSYLITIEQIAANKEVGIASASAMQKADLKIIANAGDAQSGITRLGEVVTTSGGTQLAGMLAALAQTNEGKSLLDGLTKRLGGLDTGSPA